ncbi:uncharacterized protein CXorf38-like [Dunckerocampus dactyliophorus]|uniref:uncharacterized protein CXorf38-like n=1 Tax=Dunckerocampus dactyliophorus TaxID=161453 RepID=UPI0024075191|nr:uncharacterized protein CXorf38-like [Dunckerocampus dactyliophorus]
MNEDLAVRMNQREYTNWLKAGQCLYILKDALLPFIDEQMRAFHADLLRKQPRLRELCQNSCQPRSIELSRACRLCLEWKSEILKHHVQRDPTLNWGNCTPSSWRTDHWELAKAYMPRGQGHVTAAQQCDPSALLNLINYCDWFASVNVKTTFVRELIKCRNELMHSCNLGVTDQWMKNFKDAMKRFMQLFSHVACMAPAEEKINRMLAADLSIFATGLDAEDSPDMGALVSDSVNNGNISPDLISLWEADLLQERLRELRHTAEEQTMDTEQLKMLDGFLQENKDLSERFSAELQAIGSLGA